MSNYIQTANLDLTVYGQRQVSYTVDNVAGYAYYEACMKAAYKRATTMENELAPVTAAVRARARKMEEVSDALAGINGFLIALTKVKLDDTEAKYDKVLLDVYRIMEKYDLNEDGYVSSDGKCSKANAQKVQSILQMDVEKENNGLQQDANTLQSLVSKRDQCYSFVGKVQSKIRKAIKRTTENIRA